MRVSLFQQHSVQLVNLYTEKHTVISHELTIYELHGKILRDDCG